METYGAYMELTYILCNGDLLKMDQVFNMNVHQALFTAEYLIRKKTVENNELRQQQQRH